ncbi:hypothetical protein Tco_1499217 [Tanacetum coccineum]
MMISCTNKGKPLALPWGRTPRLDSGVRGSLVLGFPSISPIIVSGQSGTLVGRGSACNCGCECRLPSAILDDALVPREQRLRIRNCNFRLSTTFKPKEPTFQVALDVLSLTPFYQAFLISASVPAIYMHEFWATICLNLPGQKFEDPPFEEEILALIRKLGYSRNMKSLSDVKVETLPQPWRTFGTIINKCLSGKVTGNDLLRISQAQILWACIIRRMLTMSTFYGKT